MPATPLPPLDCLIGSHYVCAIIIIQGFFTAVPESARALARGPVTRRGGHAPIDPLRRELPSSSNFRFTPLLSDFRSMCRTNDSPYPRRSPLAVFSSSNSFFVHQITPKQVDAYYRSKRLAPIIEKLRNSFSLTPLRASSRSIQRSRYTVSA